MRPDRMGRSRWAKVTPWYYTPRRKRARRAECGMAILHELVAEIGEDNIRRAAAMVAATGMTTAEACARAVEVNTRALRAAAEDDGWSIGTYTIPGPMPAGPDTDPNRAPDL